MKLFPILDRSYSLLILYVVLFFLQSVETAPPKTPPSDELLNGYSINGSVPIEYFYVDDTAEDGNFTHYKYSEKSITAMIEGAAKSLKKYESLYANMMTKRSAMEPLTSKKELEIDTLSKIFLVAPKSEWLHVALSAKQFKYSKFAIRNKVVAVIGSSEPWCEAVLLALGASHVYTLEYNQLTLGHEKITTITGHALLSFYESYSSSITYNNNDCNISESTTVDQQTCTPRDQQHTSSAPLFDTVIAISSLDHDGLGRYGDPLNPDGDLESMSRIARMVKPGGHMFITVPVGSDMVVFNLLRRYGPIRLPRLLEAAAGFSVVDKLGWEESRFTATPDFRHSYEPVIILKKQGDDESTAKKSATESN